MSTVQPPIDITLYRLDMFQTLTSRPYNNHKLKMAVKTQRRALSSRLNLGILTSWLSGQAICHPTMTLNLLIDFLVNLLVVELSSLWSYLSRKISKY